VVGWRAFDVLKERPAAPSDGVWECKVAGGTSGERELSWERGEESRAQSEAGPAASFGDIV
jgi:hypothetical protein